MLESGFRTIETSRRQLGYTSEFGQMLQEHPGIIHAARRLTARAEAEYNPGELQIGPALFRWNRNVDVWDLIQEGAEKFDSPRPVIGFLANRGTYLAEGQPLTDPTTGLEVTILGKTNRNPETFQFPWLLNKVDRATYLKMKLGDQAFFVKKSSITNNSGFQEFTNTMKAKQALAPIRNLAVVEAQLGYTTKTHSWFVSKWKDLENAGFGHMPSWEGFPHDYGRQNENIDEIQDSGSFLQIEERFETIREEIKQLGQNAGLDIGDLTPNLFYNPVVDQFFLLDVTTQDTNH